MSNGCDPALINDEIRVPFSSALLIRCPSICIQNNIKKTKLNINLIEITQYM